MSSSGPPAGTRAIAWALTLPLFLTGALPALGAEVTADFITGTYVIEGRCEKLAKIQAGGPKNVETVPETLTRDGFQGWESGCSFKWIKQKKKGQVWVARMACGVEAEEYEEMDTFKLNNKDRSLTVTVDGKTTKFVRCEHEKEN